MPDPFSEIRLVALRSLSGANYWSRFPVTRLDLEIGVFDEISSADVPAASAALVQALPRLAEHRCSVGERGGFVARLRQGTYAAHITEHVALELQTAIGHRVGFGRARGGERPGEYTVIVEHRHSAVGELATTFALELVQRAFAGCDLPVREMTAALAATAERPDEAGVEARVACGITGSGPRRAVRDVLAARVRQRECVLDLPPAQLLEVGLPYRSSCIAVILGSEIEDVPRRYREPERAERLLSVIADGVPDTGVIILPATEHGLRHRVEAAGRTVALFSPNGETIRNGGAAATARIGQNRIEIVSAARGVAYWSLEPRTPPAAQLVAALAQSFLDQAAGEGGRPDVEHA